MTDDSNPMNPATTSPVDATVEPRARAGDRVAAGVALHYRVFRRTLDVVVSLVGLVLTVPLFIPVAAVIATTSRGPVFFSQERIGRHGVPFTVVKFRTMRHGTHDEVLGDEHAREQYVANGYKLHEDDPRITRIGRWLRKTSLDELPQLVNVLAGQMSVVGVRPLVPDEFAARSPNDRALYCRLRPGLTGWWQVAGRSSLEPASRIELDRHYLEHCSVALDLRILARTPAAVLRTSDAR